MNLKCRRGATWKVVILAIAGISVLPIFTMTMMRTFNATPIFRSEASIMPMPAYAAATGDAKPVSPQEILAVCRSETLISSVADRIKNEDRQIFMAAYKDQFSLSGPMTAEDVLAANQQAYLDPETQVVVITYDHPDALLAAKIANYFADECINYYVRLAIEMSMRHLEDYRNRSEHQREKVEEIFEELGRTKEEAKRMLVQSDYDVNYELYKRMMTHYQEGMVKVAILEAPFQILDKAAPTTRPISPNIQRNVLLGGVLPLGVFLLLAILLFGLGRSEKSDAPPPLPR